MTPNILTFEALTGNAAILFAHMDLDLAELEPKFKEILYHCLEDVRATKAALYLMGDSKDFHLATQYGFRDGLRELIGFSDDIADQLVTRRAPFFVNGLTEDSRFSEVLYNANTTRMLVSPIYSRGKLVGFVDMRDKAGNHSFGTEDLAKAQKISDQFVDLFAKKLLYGQKLPTLTNVRLPRLDHPEADSQNDAPGVVSEARAAISRGVLRKAMHAQSLTEAQFAAGAVILPGVLGLEMVVMASLSEFSPVGGQQHVVARGEVTKEALEQFHSRLHNWLHRRGESAAASRVVVAYPYGQTAPQVTPVRLASMLSAPVKIRGLGNVILSVAFEGQPAPEVRGRLETFLDGMQHGIENAMARETLANIQQKAAEKLLEPDLQTFPALLAHSRRVAELAERLARAIGLATDDVEHVRICGLVHDVGLRLLDYSKLYRSGNVTADDIRLMREHPVVGAALVADSPLGPEVAKAVYMHHERPDGTGYPEGVTGEKIPLASRIVHLCEAYDAMTAIDSYQHPVDAAMALAKIRREAGSQFDPDLANRFCEMLGG